MPPGCALLGGLGHGVRACSSAEIVQDSIILIIIMSKHDVAHA